MTIIVVVVVIMIFCYTVLLFTKHSESDITFLSPAVQSV